MLELLEERLAPATSAFFDLPANLAAQQGAAFTVPVRLDHLSDGSGHQGLSAAQLVLTYDPAVFSVANVDVTDGLLLSNAPAGVGVEKLTDWTVTVNAANAGELDLSAVNTGPLTDIHSPIGGVLAEITFHVLPGAAPGNAALHVVVPPQTSTLGHVSSSALDGTGAAYVLNAADQMDAVVHVAAAKIITVTSTSPDAAVVGSLPWAVGQANADTSGTPITITFDTVAFATRQTISLAGTLDLNNTHAGASITISGPSAGLEIDGGQAIFGGRSTDLSFSSVEVEPGTTAALADLALADGLTINGTGGAIENNGTLALDNVTLFANTARGDAAKGGAIFNAPGATLNITHSNLSGNNAGFSGGGIFNAIAATLTINDSLISGGEALVGGGIENQGA